MNDQASSLAPPPGTRLRSRHSTTPVQIVTDASITTDDTPATTMLSIVKIDTHDQAITIGTPIACHGLPRYFPDNCKAATSSSNALRPVIVWWTNSQIR